MMMKLRVLCLLFSGYLFSCTPESGSISGSWVTEMPDQPQHKQGFTLKDDGRAVSINLENRSYERWEKQGDRLMLSGKNNYIENPTDIIDTFKIVAVTDSILTIENDGKQIRYTKTSEPEKLVNDYRIYECFMYKLKKDSAFLHINTADSIVTGELVYAFFEKDMNQGKIEGRMHGDTLFAQYTFVSEGTESTRELAFVKKGSGWIEGFGEMLDQDGSMVFKDRAKLRFRRGLHFKGIMCPESIR